MSENDTTRTEHDLLGEKTLPAGELTGIHTARAVENFGDAGGPVHPRLIRAYGTVKLACAQTNEQLGFLPEEKAGPICRAAEELADGRLDYPRNLAALQGGAGTSTNMTVNELIANRALVIAGKKPGDSTFISPLDHVNLHQSTNDTYPTALRVAAISACRELEQTVSELVDALQHKEQAFGDVVKLGRTQLQDAVLTTMGRQMGAFAEALSRDRWRIYKCEERLRTINLGGTAIGTGLGAPRRYIFTVAETLRKLTGMGLARAENLVQATQNVDELVEVSGILKALATNLFKISSDLRLLGCGPIGGIGELKLPPRQAGSSVMPGKVNPVIAELAGMVAMQAVSRDAAISMAAMNGQLELNAFTPLIAHNLLSMLDELLLACEKLRVYLIEDLDVNRRQCRAHVDSSTAILTAMLPKIGYDRASEVARAAEASGQTIKETLIELKICTEEEFEELVSPEAVMALGFR